MVIDKVTKEILMKFAVGDIKTFTMPNYNKARSAQSYASQMKKATMGTPNQREFKAVVGDPDPDSGRCSVTITRLA